MGKSGDPRTSLRVPPGCTGDTTKRLTAHTVQAGRPRTRLKQAPWRVGRQSCAHVALKILCPQPPYVALAVTRGDRVPSPRGRPLVRSRRGPPSPARVRVRSSVSNLPFGVSVSANDASKAHQAHVSPLSCQAFACIRPVMRDHRGGTAYRPGFLLPFGCRHSLLGPSCSRRGIPPFSRSAYPSPV